MKWLSAVSQDLRGQDGMEIKIDEVKSRILAASKKSTGQPVSLVLVSKTVSIERIVEAVRAGGHDFGENKVQELLSKKESLKQYPEAKNIRWHMIGNLQTNKVKLIIGECEMIHSLDRIDLVREIEKQAVVKKISAVKCLIQVNSTGEASKFGIRPEEVRQLVSAISATSPVKICGLMTIGPTQGNESEIRRAFQSVRKLQSELKVEFPDKSWDILSMGMSGDFEIAVEEGATVVRVGSLIFGARKY